MALPPDDQDDVDDAVQASKRGDVIRAKMHQLQTRIEILRKEAKEADILAAEALKRRKLLTKAKTVGGGFLLKLPTALWTDELRSAFRLGAVNCRRADQDAWKILLADLETAWFAKSDDNKPGATSESTFFETGPMELSPPRSPHVAPTAIPVSKASPPLALVETLADAVSPNPAAEALPTPDAGVSQSNDSSPSIDTSPVAAPAPDPASEPPETPVTPSRDDAPAVPINPVTTPYPDKEAATLRPVDPQQLITVQEFLALGYHGRKPYVAARNPVMALLTAEELSAPGILSSERDKMLRFRAAELERKGAGE